MEFEYEILIYRTMFNKLFSTVILLLLAIGNLSASNYKSINEPDSAYLFAYNGNGLRFAWSLDQSNWNPIGNGYIFLKCDYGQWGAEKKMVSPYLIKGRNDKWVAVWSLNNSTRQFAVADSKDLINWGPQNYPYVSMGKNVLSPIISYDVTKDDYTIIYVDSDGKYYQTKTKDFKLYDKVVAVTAAAYRKQNAKANINGTNDGQLHRVSWSVISGLKKAFEIQLYKGRLNSETTKEDAQRFAGLTNVTAQIKLQAKRSKPISDMLTGIFFEDLNYAADGGLYGELIQNRDFEYHPSDKKFRDKNWNNTYAWSIKGEKATLKIDSVASIHINNPNYAILDIEVPGASLVNSGFDGIAVKKNETYNFSAFVKTFNGKNTKLEIRLVSDKAGIVGRASVKVSSSSWKAIKVNLIGSIDAADVKLEIQPATSGRIAFDMVSLFPKRTFKDRKNGLRADLATAIADIRPRFVRFPGGCLAHGDGIHNIYKWKNTIGSLESRKGDRNLWGYHQTMGLGYFEYFQFCEDIGAKPVPVIAAGVPCQNSATGGGGQQGGIPMAEMGQYIQDIIDLVEYANGDIHTKWGKKRADAGHPAPFNLQYIGIGNEDQITEVFKERFIMIYNALKKAHPEITVIGTAGPFFEGTDYEEGWKIASDLKVPIIDEHYYQSPGWFINNQDFYDSYDRSKSKVYLGEYAASLPGGNKTNLETALAEALYLTSLERNGDVVSMASYAPLIAKEGHTQWNPDLIYFNNVEVKPTIGYYVQQLYGQNAGDEYIPTLINLNNGQESVGKRIACSVVRNSKTNELIIKMVNLLPTSVETALDLNEFSLLGTSGIKSVLSGNPADKTLRPVITDFNINWNTSLTLPAYSFTVLKFKIK